MVRLRSVAVAAEAVGTVGVWGQAVGESAVARTDRRDCGPDRGDVSEVGRGDVTAVIWVSVVFLLEGLGAVGA